MKTRNILIKVSAFLILLMPIFSMAQSEWMVSDKKQNEKNPIAFSEESVKAGKLVFLANCKSCHGDPGKANGLPLVPTPTDIALPAFLDKNSNGSIYNKMTDGQATMPSYKAILSNDQRWNVVNYIRSFDANHVADKPATIVTVIEADNGEIGEPYYLDIAIDTATTEAIISFFGTTGGQKVAIKDAEVFVGIKRYFGNLAIMEAGATTDENGIIKTTYPIELPSGETGAAELIAYPVDTEKYGEVIKTMNLTTASVEPSHFNETRALWADRGNFPIWLIVTYLSFVLLAWGVMAKAIMNVIKIKKIGN